MLLLSRRVGEEILIGDDIRVVLVAYHGSRARIGIVAPPGTRILRRELAFKDRQQKEQDSETSADTQQDGPIS